jgi:hypothetical protein
VSGPLQFVPVFLRVTNRTSLNLLSRGSSLRSASQNRTCVGLHSRVAFDWPVGCYSSPGSHDCDSSVAIFRGGGDHESLARGPWLHQFTWLSWKLDPVSRELCKGSGPFILAIMPKKDNLHPEIEVCQCLCAQGVDILVKATQVSCN